MINFTSKPRYDLSDLIRLVHVLRAPGGCPWDAAQTHLSIRRNFLEEAYEACEKFIRRFTAMEQTALAEGRPLETLSKDELLAGWNAQKRVVPGGEQ